MHEYYSMTQKVKILCHGGKTFEVIRLRSEGESQKGFEGREAHMQTGLYEALLGAWKEEQSFMICIHRVPKVGQKV